MHQMYQKACELYEKAVEKVNASGLKLPTSLLPRPPAPFMPPGGAVHAGHLGATTATGVGGRLPIPGLLPPPPPPLLPHSLSIIGAPPHPIPPAPGVFNSDPVYQAAYASAYQQTLKAIPAPKDGGPTPDTPEFAAMWQRYMDHYLRYYLRTNTMTTTSQEQPQQQQHQPQQQQQQKQQIPLPPKKESAPGNDMSPTNAQSAADQSSNDGPGKMPVSTV
ncbi:unnamed protein product [Echinostoma caproni]|uniref:Suf domain-containing protein n=1 Tax=Echinostoma caproni TaxID=27848 RepID=A0A183B0D6_9TREM|nr:unnamed protein product [Echinostoma caproni]